MRRSKVLEKLRGGNWIMMVGLGFAPAGCVAELAGMCGIDCLWLDMEHRPLDYPQVFSLIQGARAADTDCVVRVRKSSYSDYFRVLEDGAAGIMVPHVKSAQEVQYVIENCKYPPLGMRGIDCVGVDCDYGMSDMEQHMEHANHETFTVIQIEEKEAVDNIDEIAAVKGIDILFIGTADLKKSYGASSNKQLLLDEAIVKVSAAAEKHGIWWGIPAGTPELVQKYIGMGARFFNLASDRSVLAKGFSKLVEDFSKIRV